MSVLLIDQNIKKIHSKSKMEMIRDIKFESNDIYINFINDNVLFKQEKVISNKNKSIIGFMLGEIYNVDNYKYNLDIEYVIEVYEKFGEEYLRSLNGKYLIVICDLNKKLTLIINDRYGHLVTYYTINNGKYAFCNDPNVLLDYIDDRQLNEEAIVQYLKYGMQLDEQTLLKNIRKVNPATIIKISNDDVNFEKYWDWNCIRKNNKITYDEAVTECGKLWIRAVKKIMMKHQKFVLPLSGGLDSRAILAAVDYLGLNEKIHKTYTMNEKGKKCWDYIIAKRIAEIANVKNEVWEYTADVCFENEEDRIKNILGSPTFKIGQPYKYSKTILPYPLLDGLAGDAVLGGSFLKEDVIGDKSNYYKTYKSKLRGSGIKNIQILQEKLDDIIEGIQNYENYSCYDFFMYDTRVRNYVTAGVETIGVDLNTINPFFENELFDFMYSIPDEWKINWRLYKDMLIKFFPKFYIDIPWQMTGEAIEVLRIDKENCLDLNKLKRTNYKININKLEKKVILFGASSEGQKIYNIIKFKYENIFFCDNDEEKWNKEINGVKIISPSTLLKLNKKEEIIIIITSMYDMEIAKQLKSMGINKFYKLHFNKNNKSFRDYNKYVCDNRENIYSAFSSNSYIIQKYFRKEELIELLDNHVNHGIYNYRDILTVYNLIKFYNIYF